VTATEVVERVRAAAERTARGHGCEVFDVQFRRESHGWVLRVLLDRPESDGQGGVTVEDCRLVSQDLSAVLDVEDPIDRAYTLEVSSPGLDRPLRGVEDYVRFRGRLVKIVTGEAIDGQNAHRGRLGGVESGVVLLETAKEVRRIPFAAISRGKLEVEF
jgi:ribosome maturation factor RimP